MDWLEDQKIIKLIGSGSLYNLCIVRSIINKGIICKERGGGRGEGKREGGRGIINFKTLVKS